MYARDLSLLLHQWLAEPLKLDDTLKRFERLRGHGLLPRGRENAAVRLSDEQIASAVLAFTPTRPGWAGHVALILGKLRPVGGRSASFKKAETLNQSVAALIANEAASDSVIHLTLSIALGSTDDDYHARLMFKEHGKRKIASFVSHMAVTLLQEGAEKSYDTEFAQARSSRQLVLGRDFFRRLCKDVALSRHLNRPFQTDWREYETEEERETFYRKLGARNSSRFMNIGVDTQVTWPNEPIRIEFGGHHFVLFPKTKENSHSISIDIAREKLSSEEALTLMNRFLSLLSWCDDQHANLGEGWTGNRVPAPVPRRDLAFTTTAHWIFNRSIPKNEDLLQRLAYLREGLNAREAGIASYEVLSFFKVFENRKRSKRGEVNATKVWIAEVFDDACRSVRSEVLDRFHEDRQSKSVEKYIFENCRVATAHASENYPSDADASPELRRLIVAAEVMHALARYFIQRHYSFSDSYFSDEQSTEET